MMLMPFVSLTRKIYRERIEVHAAAGGADGADPTPSKPEQGDKKTA